MQLAHQDRWNRDVVIRKCLAALWTSWENLHRVALRSRIAHHSSATDTLTNRHRRSSAQLRPPQTEVALQVAAVEVTDQLLGCFARSRLRWTYFLQVLSLPSLCSSGRLVVRILENAEFLKAEQIISVTEMTEDEITA
jgi:hypothetical protein